VRQGREQRLHDQVLAADHLVHHECGPRLDRSEDERACPGRRREWSGAELEPIPQADQLERGLTGGGSRSGTFEVDALDDAINRDRVEFIRAAHE